MTTAVWYAVLLFLQIIRAGFGDIDVYLDSRLYLSAELNGSLRSGVLLVNDEIIGEYESSARYRQVYLVFPTMELPPLEKDPPAEPIAEPIAKPVVESVADETLPAPPPIPIDLTPTPAPPPPVYASGPLPPLVIDFTTALLEIASLDIGEERELPEATYEELAGTWLLRREQNRLSLSNPDMGLIVILHFNAINYYIQLTGEGAER